MNSFDTQEVAKHLLEHMKNHSNLALFAGAGVGIRAGLPSWEIYLKDLADFTEPYDKLSADLIRKRCEKGHLTNAALIYKTCPNIPKGELYKNLALPFIQPSEHNELNALVTFPFSAMVTTNYDRSLHEAYSVVLRKAPYTVELDDPTMQTALFKKEFFIARIHGRAEVPSSMIIDENDFTSIKDNKIYTDFVTHMLTRYSCVFVGFSFLDPSIKHILSLIEEYLSPNYPKLHIALLPDDTPQQLITRLAQVNIKTIIYNSSYEHFALWEGIKETSRHFSADEKYIKPEAKMPLEAIHRFLATSYARTKMSGVLQPLKNVVLDGIIIDILREEENLSEKQVAEKLKDTLKVNYPDAETITKDRIAYLCATQAIAIIDTKIIIREHDENPISNDLKILATGVSNRLLVRHYIEIEIEKELDEIIVACIESILLARSWDLGASFVGTDDIGILDISSTVQSVVEQNTKDMQHPIKEKISLSLLDLFQHPSNAESEILANLGRVSYALQLVLNVPSASSSHSSLLPEIIYLDSNVLMPAIIEGHPYHSVYSQSLKRLGKASKKANVEFSVGVANVFLSEVIGHRELAIREIEERNLENPDKLANYILYAGTISPNVFIGAYATWVGREKKKIAFKDFLREAAPYKNEGELMAFLEKKGIQTYEFPIHTANEQRIYNRIYLALRNKNEIKPDYLRKKDILIEHEAKQLYQLSKNISRNKKSIFVTADKKLIKDATNADIGKPASTMMSHRGLIQLIDMLVGLDADPVSMTSLLWGGLMTNDSIVIINYFTNLAIKTQQEAMSMSLSEVLETFVPAVLEDAKREHISLLGNGGEDQLKLDKFLDRFEENFYAEMAKAIKKYEA